MKTQGLNVVDGYLVLVPHLAVPVQFWNRLKHEITKRGLLEELAADYRRERDAVVARREGCVGWEGRDEDWSREERLFRRWTERGCGPQSLWPWERGWTEEAVDAYLTDAKWRAVAEARAGGDSP